MKNIIRILGSSGSKSIDLDHTTLQITHNITIDAGNILYSLGDDARFIDHIFVTHAHLDHIADIPFLIDSFFEYREKTLNIYAIKGTIEEIKKNIFNNVVWPDFSKIKLLSCDEYAITFHEINYNQTLVFEDCSLRVIRNNHTPSSCGFVIKKNQNSILFTSDTYKCKEIWDEVNNDPSINAVIVDVSFPSEFEKLVEESKHLTPKLLQEELKYLDRDDVTIFVNHLKPFYLRQIQKELAKYNVLKNNGAVLQSEDIINMSNISVVHNIYSKKRNIQQLNEIGIALSSEKDLQRVMDKVLQGAKRLCRADAGTIYLMNEDKRSLKFAMIQTTSMELEIDCFNDDVHWTQLPLYENNGEPNTSMVSVMCALENRKINIEDINEAPWNQLEGPKNFESVTGYKSKSMLLVPMVNHDNDVIGVIQLINKLDEKGNIIEFDKNDEEFLLSIASQVAISISNKHLINGLETLLDSFIETIATAIGEKSAHTGGHINKVAEITELIVNEINKDKKGIYKDVYFDEVATKQMMYASWLHDIGKITTPEYIIDKGTKLETISDRIELIETRFEILKRDLTTIYLDKLWQTQDLLEYNKIKTQLDNQIQYIEEDFAFIHAVNFGLIPMNEENLNRIEEIASQQVIINNKNVPLLTQDEIYNLSIKHGTLNAKEREIINQHAIVSIKMLEKLPFPKHLKDVPEIAGGHHEKICGGGYPFGLKGDEIRFEARIIAIADIFEAILSTDRPYKKANTLDKAMRYLHEKAKKNEIDKDLVKFFVEKKIYLKYAKKYLTNDQMGSMKVDFSDL